MKLINHTLLFLSAVLFVTVGLWAVLFYFQVLNQVKTTLDEGLANYKIILIDKLKDDSLIVPQHVFAYNNYIIQDITENYALQVRDSYKDTLIFSVLQQKSYRTRLLTTAFVAGNGKYYEMKVISPELDNEKLIGKLAASLLWLFLFLFLSTLIVNNAVLKKTWKPFYKLLNHLNDFRLGKDTLYDPPESKILEFSLLNKSVRKLLKSNVDIFNSQKQLIENASHEMQTPLAIGINKLELFAGEENLSSRQLLKIGTIIDSFRRLSNLNRSLLLLSKIENKQFISVGQISFDEVISRIKDDFFDFSAFRKISIEYQKEGDWFLSIHKDLADMLVMNLLKNAIIYNRQGGEVVIHLSGSGFTIENTSDEPAIPPEKLFKRFNRNPGHRNSTGLGMAIVKAIADVCGLCVNYSYNGKHVFSVSLPE